MKDLKDKDQVIIPTDKTNSFELLDIKTLDIFIQKHLNKKVKQIDKARLSSTVDKALKFIDEWYLCGSFFGSLEKLGITTVRSSSSPRIRHFDHNFVKHSYIVHVPKS